jgi:flagellar M-ring protein FliF
VDQFKKMFGSMSISQRLSIAVMAIAAIAALAWFSSWRREANFKPLYRNLASEDASQALQKLKEAGIEFRLADDGNTILVPGDKLPETRLTLAREGLPKTGRIGFELFDKTTFGTTDFAEQVNYRRALEGELERTISTLGEVERARVHLTFAKDSVFAEARRAAKASVMLNLRHAAAVSPANVAAIAHLVASAVDGLSADQVTIVDTRGDLLNKPHVTGSLGDASNTRLEYRAALEHDLQSKLTQTLDPVLGGGSYRVGVSVDCDFAGVEENEEVWDPTKSVMVSSQRTEESSSEGLATGVPGTQANLPEPPQRPAGAPGTTRKTESSNFQTSRKVRHVEQARGEVKRITVAVLLDQEVHQEGKGAAAKRTFIPPAQEKIAIIRNLVTNVAGLNTTRGDQITVESLPFDTTMREGLAADEQSAPKPPAAPLTWSTRLMQDHTLQGAAGGGVAILVLGAWLLMRKRKSLPVAVEVAPQLAPAESHAVQSQALAPRAIGSSLSADEQANLEHDLMESLKIPDKGISKAETLTKFLRQEIKRDPQAATQLLRAWLLEEER